MEPRAAAASALAKVIRQGRSLASVLPVAVNQVETRNAGLVQELCYGSARWYPQLQRLLAQLLVRPLKAKDSDIKAALIIGLYQLIYTRVPDHAAISASVNATRQLKKDWASKLVNGVLRRFQRERDALMAALADDPEYRLAHPAWMIDAIDAAWPQQAAAIFTANNDHPPFTLRANTRRVTVSQLQQQLRDADIACTPTPFSDSGVTLARALDVNELPGFQAGQVSVQDEAAQLAAGLLLLQPGQRVLDACCAPGGKTGHILEREPALEHLVGVDLEARRLQRVSDNLERLQLQAELICGDATQPQQWWQGPPFDRILLDAPCSATGVIRRHPDIKLLRNSADIAKLAQLQLRLLQALWPLLAPGGMLVYATCSIMPAENTEVIEQFLSACSCARHHVIDAPWGLAQPFGRQLLPRAAGHDGFYYARLQKAGAAEKTGLQQ
ncbi:16S rRNA (cytosine(967)-C(5))-methyltransferase RsmB [Exilibacterium tricleocarpae]|uniref:16S rRNA (cytosine(967)-C(5))-methyltransferase n=1 Tax=Exilibacterium tricleocarpae TaxID=2591008 RepID=A0A545T0E2_9GAMM|nr:16S rRNA (cytosine(967)-C(5))-methyltransferase RsmB [Exilibacterium tricleocarpae]TQV70686.1 16S rRNA (cytosine(967)-C(5))-methyltransferase RsmB [Exilibacterium tricleocarpae]